ncbi:hypothetical protein GCM10009798_06320 [Nocardioides panacihumi]|uniref:Fibronectin type-III domain-containing protein n=1 Tax=Nocardioides panacihumi TaxID=400774 RepID=A0ABN2QCW2_9ACTN
MGKRTISALSVIAVIMGTWAMLTPPTYAAGTAYVSAGPDVVVGEGQGSVTIPVTLSAAADATVTVNFATNVDTAGSGDFTAAVGSLTFPAGVTERDVTIPVTDDATVEQMEDFDLTLISPSANATIGKRDTLVSIVDNDTVTTTPAIYAAPDLTVDESDGTAHIPITLGKTHGQASNTPVTVHYATSDTTGPNATAGTDYTPTSGTLTFAPGDSAQTIPIDITNDTTTEGPERFQLDLTSPTGATLAEATTTITIGPSDATASTNTTINAGPDTVVGEGDGYVELPVTLTAPAQSVVTVNYATNSDTAGSGDFRNFSATGLLFQPGETTKTVRIPVTDDATVEQMEDFDLTLISPSANATIGKRDTLVSIVDNDTVTTTPAIYAAPDLTVDESDGTAHIPITLGKTHGQASNTPVTVHYATSDTTGPNATAGTDYTPTSGTLTFAPGDSAQTIPIDISDDTTTEGPESFRLLLTDPAGGLLIDPTSVVTIGGSDATPASSPGISAGPDISVGEGDGYVDVPVSLTAPSQNAVTVNYATNSATAGSADFRNFSATGLLFRPGETSKTVRIPLRDDILTESPETFDLVLSSPTNATISDSTRVVTIADNDSPATVADSNVTVSPSSVVADGLTPTYVTVTLNDASPHPAANKYVVLTPSGSAQVRTWSGDSDGHGVVTFEVTDTVQETVSLTADDVTDNVTLSAHPSVTFTAAPNVPGPPTGVDGTAGDAQVALSWTAPADDGGSAITGYTITPYVGGSAKATLAVGNVTSTVVSGLVNGTTYTFTVAATNAAGTGAQSAASPALTPATVPAAPTGVSGASGNGQVDVHWTAPTADGGSPITGYVVTPFVGATAQSPASVGNVTSTTIRGLSNGTAYTFKVHAVNAKGAGPDSAPSPSVVPQAGVPGPPTGVAGTPGDGRVALSWSGPGDNGGSPITHYVVTPYVGATPRPSVTVGNVLRATITGLTNGTSYTFTVAAQNTIGTGAPSAHSAPLRPVRPTLSITVSASRIRHGRPVTVSGAASPPFDGTVHLQRRRVVGGTTVWVTVGSGTLSAGRYSLRLRLTRQGTYRFRVMTVPSTGHPALTSATGTVKVV